MIRLPRLAFRRGQDAAPAVGAAPAPRGGAAAVAHWAAGPLGYVAGMVLLAKLARALELSLRLHSARPWLILPATLGQDALLVAAVGLIAYGLGKLRWPRARWTLTLLLLVPIGLLLPADVIAQLLTGRPLTVQRIRGDAGASIKDLNLLATADLLAGIAGIAVALLLLWAALRWGSRSALLRRWARPKALLITLLLGFSAGLAQGALVPRTHGLDEQPVFVLLGSFVGQDLSGVALTEAEWHALLAPSEALPPPPAVPPLPEKRPKNVVIFAAEGIPFKDTGFDPQYARLRPGDEREVGAPWPNPTPNLTRRAAQHGLVFDRYYANWHASIQAIFSLVCSSFPPMSGDIVRIKPRIDCGELSESMKRGGVTAGLFHSGQFSFYNKLALLGRRKYAIELDSEELTKSSKRARQQWGIDDRAMTEATLDWVDSLPKGQPFAALLIAITAHYPYWVPRDFKRPFTGDTRHERFLNAVAFQDQVFEDMVRGFEQRGLYEDTLFVWLGDHGHYVAEPERETPGLRGFYEPNLHTPLLLLNARMFPEALAQNARVNGRLGSHVDLLPTVLDVLGIAPDPRHMGQSLLSPAFEQRRMYFGADDGHFAGFIEGWHKYALELRTGRGEYYDLRADPDELRDLSAREPARMQSYRDDALRFARGIQARIERAPVLDEAVSVVKVYDLFMDHVRVASGLRERPLPCAAGKPPSCPGIGEVLRVATKRVQWEKRRCVMVMLPVQGAVELTVDAPDVLDLLTGTMLALPNQPKERPNVRVTTTADGRRPNLQILTPDAAIHVRHPRAKDQLRFSIEQLPGAKAPGEVCLQLTALVSQ